MQIKYDHSRNLHTLDGPRAALPLIVGGVKPNSVLDVGCGNGTWLKAALELGISDVYGIDGVNIPSAELLLEARLFRQVDFRKPWDLKRRFDLAFCLEVAEHLEEKYAQGLINALVQHADTIVFSAACPGQPGQNHVNCHWPEYWQRLFNSVGYVCDDSSRWQLWNSREVEPWYRQNVFIARRAPEMAGREQRIKAVLHPEVQSLISADLVSKSFSHHVRQIEDGRLRAWWYVGVLISAGLGKLRRWVQLMKTERE